MKYFLIFFMIIFSNLTFADNGNPCGKNNYGQICDAHIGEHWTMFAGASLRYMNLAQQSGYPRIIVCYYNMKGSQRDTPFDMDIYGITEGANNQFSIDRKTVLITKSKLSGSLVGGNKNIPLLKNIDIAMLISSDGMEAPFGSIDVYCIYQ